MSALREAEAAGEKVVAHCTHGMGRSGRVGGRLVPDAACCDVHGSIAYIHGHARTSGTRTHMYRAHARDCSAWLGEGGAG
jgi:hypothetical protein